MSVPGRILIAPLDWGLGHAARCLPLVQQAVSEGKEVWLGGSGRSGLLLRQHYPHLPYIPLPSYPFQYSRKQSQVGAVLKALPGLLYYAWKEHRCLHRLVQQYGFERVISDNRFGFWCRHTESVYMTHQLHICLPAGFRWLEGVAEYLHRTIIQRYTVCWVPDREELSASLAGKLSHPKHLPSRVRYIGPLSHLAMVEQSIPTDYLLLISGAEPQRSMFESSLRKQYHDFSGKVIMVQGVPEKSPTPWRDGSIITYATMPPAQLAAYIQGAAHIVCRSGYSTLMDLDALGCLHKATLLPTPGQPEQEYLAQWLAP